MEPFPRLGCNCRFLRTSYSAYPPWGRKHSHQHRFLVFVHQHENLFSSSNRASNMARTENVRVRAQGIDGAEEHELEERSPWQINQTHAPEGLNVTENQQQATEAPADPPPPYQETPEQNRSIPVRLPQISAPAHGQTAGRGRRSSIASDVRQRSSGCINGLLIIGAVGTVAAGAWLINRELNSYVDHDPSGSRHTGTQRGLPNVSFHDLFTTHTSPTTFSPVPGLYMIPATATEAHWSLASHMFPKHTKGENGKESQMKTLRATPFTIGNSKSWAHSFTPESFKGSAGFARVSRQGKENFNRWGVGILYGLHKRALSHALQVQKAWCIHNTCSTGHDLQAICNNTMQGTESQKKDKDSFERQECDWCCDENVFPAKISTQKAEIDKYCTNGSKHAAAFLSIVCCLVLVSIIVPTMILTKRALSRNNKKAEVYHGRSERYRRSLFPRLTLKFAKSSKESVSSDEKVSESSSISDLQDC